MEPNYGLKPKVLLGTSFWRTQIIFNTAIAKVALRTAIKCGQCLSQVCCATLSLRWMQCFECTYTACYIVSVENKVKTSHSSWLKVSEFHHLCRSLISLESLWKWKANGPLTKQILEPNIVLQLWHLFCRLIPEGETCREITIFTWNKAKQLVSVHFGTTPALKTSGQGQKYWRQCPALKAHNLPAERLGETCGRDSKWGLGSRSEVQDEKHYNNKGMS